MQKKKRLLILGAAGLALAVVAVFLGLRYLPLHRLIKRPSSKEIAFINPPRGPESGPYSLFYDFEVDPAKKIPSGLYQEKAHSGQFSAKTFGKNSFSVSIEKTVGELNIPDMTAVALSAWVYVFETDEEPVGSLVFTVTNRVGVNTCWKGVAIHGPLVPTGKWFKISGSFDLSEVQIRPDDKVQVYFWNNSDTRILTDDVYIVFGSQPPRRGDSALVDLTRAQYQPRFNLPPFPVTWLTAAKAEMGNLVFGEVTPNDRMIAGRFLGSGGLESLLAIRPDGSTTLWHQCPAGGFRKVSVEIPADLQAVVAASRMMKGSFTNPGTDQLLFAGENGLLLGSVDASPNICSGEGTAALKELWRSSSNEVGSVTVRSPKHLVPCDVNGDNVTELLVVGTDGSWELMKYTGGTWSSLASGRENRIGEWDDRYTQFTITAGRFLRGSTSDQLLTVFTEKSKNRSQYALVRFSAAEKKFTKALAGRQGNIGSTIGLDTLKQEDRFLFGHFGSGEGLLRYNRDWRFDLKRITFNDTTFQILGNVDFDGYGSGMNPKYYEALNLVPGRFLDPSVTSVLVVAGNAKDPGYKGGLCKEWDDVPGLPNTVGIFTFQNKLKP